MLGLALFAFNLIINGLAVENATVSKISCTAVVTGGTLIWEKMSNGPNQIIAKFNTSSGQVSYYSSHYVFIDGGQNWGMLAILVPEAPAVYKCYTLERATDYASTQYMSTIKNPISLSTLPSSNNKVCCKNLGLTSACTQFACLSPSFGDQTTACTAADAQLLGAIGKCNAQSNTNSYHFAACCASQPGFPIAGGCLELCNNQNSFTKSDCISAPLKVISQCARASFIQVPQPVQPEMLIRPNAINRSKLTLQLTGSSLNTAVVTVYDKITGAFVQKFEQAFSDGIEIVEFLTPKNSIVFYKMTVRFVNSHGASGEVPLRVAVTNAEKLALGSKTIPSVWLDSGLPLYCVYDSDLSVDVTSVSTNSLAYSQTDARMKNVNGAQLEAYLLDDRGRKTGRSIYVTMTGMSDGAYRCQANNTEPTYYMVQGISTTQPNWETKIPSAGVDQQACCVANGLSAQCAAYACAYPPKATMAGCTLQDQYKLHVVGKCASQKQSVYAASCCAQSNKMANYCLEFCNNLGQNRSTPSESMSCFSYASNPIFPCVYLAAERTVPVAKISLQFQVIVNKGVQYNWLKWSIPRTISWPDPYDTPLAFNFATQAKQAEFSAANFGQSGREGQLYVIMPHDYLTMQLVTRMGATLPILVFLNDSKPVVTPTTAVPIATSAPANSPFTKTTSAPVFSFLVTIRSTVDGAGEYTTTLADPSSTASLTLQTKLCQPVLQKPGSSVKMCQLLNAVKGSIIATMNYEVTTSKSVASDSQVYQLVLLELSSVSSPVKISTDPVKIKLLSVAQFFKVSTTTTRTTTTTSKPTQGQQQTDYVRIAMIVFLVVFAVPSLIIAGVCLYKKRACFKRHITATVLLHDEDSSKVGSDEIKPPSYVA